MYLFIYVFIYFPTCLLTYLYYACYRMPRSRVRSTNRGVPPEDLERASRSIESGLSYRKVAEIFGIPLSTLGRYMRKKGTMAAQGVTGRPSVGYRECDAVFTVQQEQSLVAYVKKAAAMYYGLPPKEVGQYSTRLKGGD